MISLLALKHIHITLVVISIGGFVLRYLGKRLGADFVDRRSVKVVPHIVDTLLLASGITLAWLYRLSPLEAPWLLAKLGLIVVYILLGIAAMRAAPSRRGDLLAGAGLATIALVIYLAVYKPI